MKSIKSSKQRKEYFNAPLHKKRKWISSHLEENLLLKYDQRGISLVKGDTVKVMRGNFKGHEGKITRINQRRRQVEVEGLVMTKADGKKIAKPIHASNLLIIKLNLTDQWRRKKLERDLSDEVKKEIEKEAQDQIIENEKEKRIIDEKEKEDKKEKIEEETDKTIKKQKLTDESFKKEDKNIVKNNVKRKNVEKYNNKEEKKKKKSDEVKKAKTKNTINNKKNQSKSIKRERGKNK
jgi:large subunit ribosomal protein L24